MHKYIVKHHSHVWHKQWIKLSVGYVGTWKYGSTKYGATNFFYTSYVIEMKPDKFVARVVHCDV